MGVKFTKEQDLAIKTLDRSILVSAAAGSGKTAVLVERIIHIILEGKANVDEMLVVTFTNAAAAEMKLKLTKAIRQRIQDDPSSEAQMSEQLSRMYRSYICTFHSFALRLMKEFFYKVDMEPNFRIIDEAENTLLQMETMEELFEECFEKDDLIEGGGFRAFLECYSSDRNEDAIMAELIDNYGKLRSMPNYFDWAYQKGEEMKYPASGEIRDSKVCQRIIDATVSELEKAYDAATDLRDFMMETGLPKLAAKIENDCIQFQELLEEAKHCVDPEGLYAKIAGLKYNIMKAANDEKETYESVKDYCKAVRDSYKKSLHNSSSPIGILEAFFNPDFETRFRELDEAQGYTVYYLNVLKEFERRFSAKKRERNVIDFSDIEHITAELLEDKAVAETMRRRFQFLFIDEYQDTNQIQEYLISKIARPDNVFKVGDVKQSIYSFRQSDPTIFMGTREEYNRPENEDATVIDLNKNFRSNGATIDYINQVFEGIMPGYDDKAALYLGRDKMPAPEYDLVPEVHVLDLSTSEFTDDDEDEEGNTPTKIEMEAVYVARMVEEIIGTPFYDSKNDEIRPATPRDIVILMRSTKFKADIYYRAMLERGIVAHVSEEKGYFNTVEIHIATALLTLLDNGRQDVALIGTLRSEIFGFTPSELAEIRAVYRDAGKHGAYWKAFEDFCENGEGELADRARRAVAKLDEWRDLAGTMPLDDYIWHVLTDSGYYLSAGAMYGGRQRQANLRILTERARKFQENGFASLNGFLRYIDILRNKGVSDSQASMISEDDDVVRIMTIHKSKGLEFPFVIVAGINGELKKSKLKRSFAFDSDIGVSVSYVNRERKFYRSTLVQHMIVRKKNEDEYQEDLRVLYVAMTRAREKLLLVGSSDDVDKLFNGVPSRKSFLEIIKGNIQTSRNQYVIAAAPVIKESGKRNLFESFLRHRDKFSESEERRIQAIYEELNERLSYRYPEEAALTTKAKYSVSELRAMKESASVERSSDTTGQAEITRADSTPRKTELQAPSALTEPAVTGADIGTAYHRIMETLDFRRVLRDGTIDDTYIQAVANHLRETNAIDEAIFAKLDLSRIGGFFESNIGERAAVAAATGLLCKEKSFTLRTDLDGKKVLVQGIIDCYFEEDGELVLIDYKSNYVGNHPEDLADMYREQIRLYKEALESGTGKRVKEQALYLFQIGRALPVDVVE